jgi:heat-inducible transcriptional repressor
VLIGGEGNWDDYASVRDPFEYGSPGIATGTLGVLGAMRMSYGFDLLVRILSGI